MKKNQAETEKWDIITDSIAWTILVIGGLLSWPVIAIVFDSIGVFIFLIILTGISALVVTVLSWLVKKLRHKKTNFIKTGVITHFGLFICSMILLSIPMWAAIIINSTVPLTLPTITLTNGEKTIVYQGMMHIGSENYYKSIIFDMVAAGDDFTFFYEGVTEGSAENEARFNNIMGLTDQSLSDGYLSLATFCDLSYQNEFFWVFIDDRIENSDQHVGMDVNIDEMIAEWDRLLVEHPGYAVAEPSPPTEQTVSEDDSGMHYSDLTVGQQKFMGRFCQAYFNLDYLNEDKSIADPFMREVILDFRNRHLADGIIDSEADKIYITYGNDHFPGVYAYLKEDDPNWEITNVRWKRVLELSQDVVGTLDVDK